jgi:hypothetical protein
MNRKQRYQLTKEKNESDMICEKIIDTNPPNKTITTDKEIIEKTVRWLELNIKSPYLNTDLITDNKNLLKAIKDWKNV